MSDQTELQLLFQKYLLGDCSPSELKQFLRLLEDEDAAGLLDKPMKAAWNDLKHNSEYPVDWEKMYQEITDTPDVSTLTIKGQSKWWRYAAAALVVPVLALSVYWFAKRDSTNIKTQVQHSAQSKSTQVPSVTGRQIIHLPDGSTAILNNGTRLNYPSSFTANRRDVYLTGEGFFDIRHEDKRPFFVHTANVTVKVLGTAFNIKAYPTQKDIQVTVTRGRVLVLKENKSVGLLSANQQLSVSINTPDVTMKIVDTLSVIKWKPAEIFLNDETMEDIGKMMTKRFDLKFDFTNPAIRHCRITATFSEDDLPEEMLTVMCAVINAEFEMNDKKITIHGKGCD